MGKRADGYTKIDNQAIDSGIIADIVRQCGPSAFAVYVYLLSYGNCKTPKRISIGDIMEKTGLSRACVRKAVSEMERSCLIQRVGKAQGRISGFIVSTWAESSHVDGEEHHQRVAKTWPKSSQNMARV